jgi:hypothetical protein
VKSKLSSQELCTVSWHGHVARALRLLSLLCDVAASLPALASVIVVRGYASASTGSCTPLMSPLRCPA